LPGFIGCLFKTPSSGNTQFGIFSEFREQVAEVTWIQPEIGIQVTDELGRVRSEHLEPGAESEHFGSKLARTILFSPDKADEGMSHRVLPDDFVGPIRRAIADDHPHFGAQHLRYNRPDCLFYIVLFIVSCGEEHVG
jgi:hypothetical protein